MVDAISGAVVQATVGTPLSETLQVVKNALLGFKEDVVSLQRTRTTIEAALLDADSLVEQSHTQRDMLEKLRCELDRLTAFLVVREVKAMRREVMGGSRIMKEARLFFSPSNQVVARFLDARKVKDIRNKLDVIAKDYSQFGRIVGVPTANQTQVWSAQATEFGVISDVIVGRDEDRDNILCLLVGDTVASYFIHFFYLLQSTIG